MTVLATQLSRSLMASQIYEAVIRADGKMSAIRAVGAILRAYDAELSGRVFCPTCGEGAPGWCDDPRSTTAGPDDQVPCPTCNGGDK